ncbi:MAG: hypothetical protein N3D17_06220 [bacterium]|nr:hypothetical protein [bacterium]
MVLPIKREGEKNILPNRIFIVNGFLNDCCIEPEGCVARISIRKLDKGMGLFIEGKDAEMREKAALKLLGLLDTKYQWYGKTSYRYLDAAVKAGVDGKYLNLSGEFVNYPWDEVEKDKGKNKGDIPLSEWWKSYEVDGNTLLLCHWDDPSDLEFKDASGNTAGGYIYSTPYTDGRFGKGILVKSDTEENGIAYENYKKWNNSEGTLELWWKPEFNSDGGRTAVLFSFRASKVSNKVTDKCSLAYYSGKLRWCERDINGA